MHVQKGQLEPIQHTHSLVNKKTELASSWHGIQAFFLKLHKGPLLESDILT